MREVGILELGSPVDNRAKPRGRSLAPPLHWRPAMTKHLLLLVALAGCEKNLLSNMDAGLDAPAPDAPTACPAVTTTPLPPGHFKLYVNTEGVDIAKCSQNDARTNCSMLPLANTTIPAFLPGDTNRQAKIDAIVVRVQEKLAPYSIDVVTTRPTSGDYTMAVLGGDPTAFGGTTGTLSLAPAVCDFANQDQITFEFDRGSTVGNIDYALSILSDFGAVVGLAGTTTSGDCLCRFNGCGPALDPQICYFGSAAMVTTMTQFSCGRTTQDEPLILANALGCR